MTNILWYIDSKGVYEQKLLWTTIMSRGDTNYILPYKTNIEVVTKAQMGLNHSVYATHFEHIFVLAANGFAIYQLYGSLLNI